MAKPVWCAILPSSGWEEIRVVVSPQTRSLCYLTPAAAAFYSQQDGSKSKDMVNKCSQTNPKIKFGTFLDSLCVQVTTILFKQMNARVLVGLWSECKCIQ